VWSNAERTTAQGLVRSAALHTPYIRCRFILNWYEGDCFFFAPMSFSQVLNDPSVQKLLPLLAAAIAGQVISLGLSTLAVG
jgi:hypothetical protein